MGSATIVSNLGAAQYTIRLTESEAALQSRKTVITTRQGVVDTSIMDKEAELLSLQGECNAKYALLMTAVANYSSADPPTKDLMKAVTDAQTAYITANSNVAKKQREINVLKLESISLAKKLEQIETALAVETRTVWCADYSNKLTGAVGTLEVNGEADLILVMPGGATGAGLLQHPLAMTPAGVFVNWAKLPAWQKWKPTYRAGVITGKSGDYCNVELDPALSSAQSLDINQAQELENVPIDYMDTDGAMFIVGDHVVVQFVGQSQSNPKVIGFVSNPRLTGWYIGFYNGQQGVNIMKSLSLLNKSGDYFYQSLNSYTVPAGFTNCRGIGWSPQLNSFFYAYIVTPSLHPPESADIFMQVVSEEGTILETRELASVNDYEDGEIVATFSGTAYLWFFRREIRDGKCWSGDWIMEFDGSIGESEHNPIVNPFFAATWSKEDGYFGAGAVPNPYGYFYAKVTRFLDGTLLWYVGNYMDSTAFNPAFKYTVDNIVTKTVYLPQAEDEQSGPIGGSYQKKERTEIKFVKEVSSKLLYCALKTTFIYTQEQIGTNPITGAPIMGFQTFDTTEHCELRLCNDKNNPSAYTVLATAPTLSITYGTGNTISYTYAGAWTNAVRIINPDSGADYYAVYYKGRVAVSGFGSQAPALQVYSGSGIVGTVAFPGASDIRSFLCEQM